MNKLTPQNFDKLSDELLQLPLGNDETTEKFVDIVFEKAVVEPVFAELYSRLTVKLRENFQKQSFFHVVHNRDTSSFALCKDVSFERLCGPFETVEECVAAALAGSGPEPQPFAGPVSVEQFVVQNGQLVRVFRDASQQQAEGGEDAADAEDDGPVRLFFASQPWEDVEGQGYETEDQAAANGAQLSSFQYRLKMRCQTLFYTEDIYAEANEMQAAMEARIAQRPDLPELERARMAADVEERRTRIKWRFLGNIRFIGELFKENVLKAPVMRECVLFLLGYDEKTNAWSETVDEQYLDAGIKLLTTVGQKLEHEDQRKRKHQTAQCFERLQAMSRDKRVTSR
eukprot:CAMPEP_0198444908 /NCGR_PEP_ID=MMETSP1452-20131203/70840_1 /TAXON_ID=1181717 /ORGANISM="Synchroma pusillum, Strain CCMP3072" /LENGTH=341 /DNA_ID=CAMNT_0044165565 /DNA_START=23 /DNA_END=1044 /DNA_ORIENTATION=+